MASESWPVRTSGRGLATALALVIHALFLLLLFWKLGDSPGRVGTQSINVELVPFPHHRPAAAPVVKKGRRAGAPPPLGAILHSAPGPAPTEVAPGRDAPVAAEGREMRSALRGLLGCRSSALVGLTPDERRRCEARMAGGAVEDRAGPAPKLNLDLHGRFASNPEPYLQRRPKNGCKVRAGGDTAPGPGGTPGNVGVASGVACALAF
jgi:hypothetical protein